MATESGDEGNVDLFKEEFKKYKRRKPPPDLSDLIDFTNLTCINKEKHGIQKLVLQEPDCIPRLAGLRPAHVWDAYTLEKFPGFVHINNPFKSNGQRYWVYRCLHDYPSKPNVTNLDFIEQQLGRERPENLWDASYSSLEHDINNRSKKIKLSSKDDETGSNPNELTKFHFDKLRWITLGYHYNWNNKTYSENEKSDFPSDLSYLSKYIAAVVNHSLDYQPEAAIINYYHLDSTLAGHTDHSEFDHNAPIISISFGQDAVFLLGGVTKAVRPIAVHLKSGDVCIMSGSTRLSYHAVPRVFQSNFLKSSFEIETESYSEGAQQNEFEITTAASRLKSKDTDVYAGICSQIQNIHKHLEWSPYEAHLEKGRINMSIRQVLKVGQAFPKSTVNES